ncbi:MAG: LysR family transcriptional regulator [Polyangiaceae bacterium]|nr:LysR family transcriptional regulator [Myxococcales bacterium]MCB9589350.1 LysR family transcriptional regulator [Polyangiaceae bacterium]
MDPSKKASEIWQWLPVFKVVAETQHLPTAARQLHVSASAISRTIRLVEEALGQELFVRSSRRLILNAAGERLLAATRRSANSLEQGLREVFDQSFSGPFRVSSLGVLTDGFVLPSLLELQAEHPGLVPHMTTRLASEANQSLVSGLLEIAFYYDATTLPGIRCESLGELTNSIYCGRGHALFGKRRVETQELLEHPFSVAAIGDKGTPMDSWPVDLPRKVGFQILMLSTNLQVSLSGSFVTVLPDAVAAPHAEADELWRLAPDLIPNTQVYAAFREDDKNQAVTQTLVSKVRERIQRAPARRRRKA